MDDLLREAIAPLPDKLRTEAEAIIEDEYALVSEGVDAMMERVGSFRSPTAAVLAGIAVSPLALANFEEVMDERWDSRKNRVLPQYVEEVVVGAGLHAAIYCGVRAQMRKPKPLVLEKRRRVGGIFAVSKSPSFFLNSRNRPGNVGVPGTQAALNVLPGALVQPADLGSDEYQTNWALSFAIRTTLAAYADVRNEIEVEAIEPRRGQSAQVKEWPVRVKVKGVARPVYTKRVIIATGLGDANTFNLPDAKRVMSFPQFMAKMDAPFPLRGMQRVAVIGGGDSGKTAIEALTGMGPAAGWSVASLDWVETIDWYSSDISGDCASYQQQTRNRYKRIGALLNPNAEGKRRVIVRPSPTAISGGFDQAFVDERPYDYVVECIGFSTKLPLDAGFELASYSLGARVVARYAPAIGREGDDDSPPRCLVVGPAAKLSLSTREANAYNSRIPENATSLFRYASRTAAVAASVS